MAGDHPAAAVPPEIGKHIRHQKKKDMKLRTLLTVLMVGLLSQTMLNSCTTKLGAIQQMERLSYDLRDNSAYYTIKDWENAAKKFGDIRKRMTRYDYTPAERRQIGELEGNCARYMVKGIKDGAINGILSVGNEIRGILDALGVKY